MEFSVVDIGYDQGQVDGCLADLAERLAWLALRTDAVARSSPELAPVWAELARLSGLFGARRSAGGTPDPARRTLQDAQREAAEILARARADLAAAREEARQVRDQVYAEAVQARRELEAALHARRVRAEQADRILRDAAVGQPLRPVGDPPAHAEPAAGIVSASAP